jgi:RHH-type rel operon transcriptional repressor/antitoxin RelB
MSKSLSVRIPDDTMKALEELADATDRPKTYLVEKALESYLAEYADYRVALDRLLDKEDIILTSAEFRKRIGRKG